MERDLRDALVSPRTTLHARTLDGDTLAWVEYEGRAVEVALDPFRGGLIECVVHELLHAVYSRRLAEWGAHEEVIVLALERSIMDRINSSKARVQWWRDAIGRKLTEET